MIKPYQNGFLTSAFWSKIRFAPNGCWEWVGYRVTGGYGTIRIDRKPILTHRLMLQHLGMTLTSGIQVCHKCDFPPCCNPQHLFLGTAKDNAQDMLAKGRGNKPRGEANGTCRYSQAQVAEVKRLHAEGKRVVDIVRATGVSRYQVYSITSGRTWAHVEAA